MAFDLNWVPPAGKHAQSAQVLHHGFFDTPAYREPKAVDTTEQDSASRREEASLRETALHEEVSLHHAAIQEEAALHHAAIQGQASLNHAALQAEASLFHAAMQAEASVRQAVQEKAHHPGSFIQRPMSNMDMVEQQLIKVMFCF